MRMFVGAPAAQVTRHSASGEGRRPAEKEPTVQLSEGVARTIEYFETVV